MDVLERAVMTIGCCDSDVIPKVADAGEIRDEAGIRVQIMHNGLKVLAGGYHGDWMAQVIRGLQGHHEPQEELVYYHLLRYVRHGSLMVELASFWAYYTLWYLREIPDSTAICVEPDPLNLEVGRRNASLNSATQRIRFMEAWVGGEERASHQAICESTGGPRDLPCVNMSSLLRIVESRPIELLHVDAQGAELPFLRSMNAGVKEQRIRFLVASTHHSSISGSPTTHVDCLREVQRLGGVVLAEHSVQESFSGDGLIVASFLSCDRRIRIPEISRNHAATSMFPTP
jgi:FkbM family methyltransferase